MGKLKILSDKFMLILASKTKYRRFIGVIFSITVAAVAVGAVYLLLRDVLK